MYETYHQIEDHAKYQSLVADMAARGWVGAPLVADGDCLITGAHRYPAALAAGIEPLVVDIRDIFPAWEVVHSEYGSPVIGEQDYIAALQEMPDAVREEYGIDVH